jgi:protein gp37
MSANSKIEWTDSTWNPIRARNLKTGKVGWYCEHVTPGCEHCYAEGMNKRLGTGLPFKPGHRKDVELFLDEKILLQTLHWKKPRMIFVCSMTDLFAEFVPDEWIDKIFATMALTPQHTYQVLTKRAARMREYLTPGLPHRIGMEALAMTLDAHARDARSLMGDGIELAGDIPCLRNWPLPNVWLGISAERQQEFNERWPDLQRTPAAVTFVSMEPLLGEIFFRPAKPDLIICGGESGPNARPMHPDWPRSLRDQCAAAGVAFFFKQWGEWADCEDYPSEMQEHLELLNRADGSNVRVGKKKAGRLLDGIEHNSMPTVAR